MNFDSPGGSGWIRIVGGYADNSFGVLGSSDPRGVRLSSNEVFMFFLFDFSSPFYILLTEFHYTFSMSY